MGMGFERYISDNWIRSLMAQSVDSVTVNMRVNSIFVNIINATSMNVTVANDKEVAKLPAREFYVPLIKTNIGMSQWTGINQDFCPSKTKNKLRVI